MFSQAFKHPRLYFPFLGLLPVIAAPIIIIALIITVLSLEPAMAFTAQRILFSIFLIVLFIFIAQKIALSFKLTQQPDTDIESFGLLNTVFIYAVQARTPEHQQAIKNTLNQSIFSLPKNNTSSRNNEITPPHFYEVFDDKEGKPHPSGRRRDAPTLSRKTLGSWVLPNEMGNITVIQSESFFDARRLHSSIKPDVLKNFDICNQQSTQFGKLKVPAWGANTMRTEFAFLSGLKYQDLRLISLLSLPVFTQDASEFNCLLLKCSKVIIVFVFIHTLTLFLVEIEFSHRWDFDEFIDIKDFDTSKTFGPYISDQAVTDKILRITKNHNKNKPEQPLFIFAITMENHGPLHLEKTTKEEQNHYFDTKPIEAINDLTVYLRHLQNADKMIVDLTSAYSEFEKPHALCFYGDHIPSMPNIYQQLSYEEEDQENPGELAITEANKSIVNIDTETLEKLLKENPKIEMLDVRSANEIDFIGGYIDADESVNITRGWLEFDIGSHVKTKDTPIIVYCGTNQRSPLAA
ncbi:hypothetical protein GQR58_020377 [Nymphon striatum]|nr:hypothetical protein GQR58_020377 [Nymphon striatum]